MWRLSRCCSVAGCFGTWDDVIRIRQGVAYQIGLFKCYRHYADRGFSTLLHPTLWAIVAGSRVNFYLDKVSVLYTWVCPACITGKRVERATVRAENIWVIPAALFCRYTYVQLKLADHYISVSNALKLVGEPFSWDTEIERVVRKCRSRFWG